MAKAKKLYDYAVNGIKNRQWSGDKGKTYLSLAAKKLGKAWVKTLNVTTGKYTVGAIGVTGVKRIYAVIK